MQTREGTVLIVDDEERICQVLARMLELEGLRATMAYDGATALKAIRQDRPSAVLLDLRMPGMDGMEVLERALAADPELPIIIVSALTGVDQVVEAMKAGARDYIGKPFSCSEVTRVVLRVLSEQGSRQRAQTLAGDSRRLQSLCELMGPSDMVARISADINRVARSDFSVVILGETGAGKELVARAIHQASPRSAKPFVPVDCGAIPESLFESELFGHEKGAFTGADTRRPGKFESAHGGTLFLDEITNMPLDCQAKLLRVVQERTLYRVGSTQPIAVDVRILAASNQDLETAAAAGTFRYDLYFRLNDFAITIPPLRDRREDIVYLAERFRDLTNAELSKSVGGFTEPAVNAILAYDWPGNVRQLRSCVRRAVLMADQVVTETHLDIPTATARGDLPGAPVSYWENRPLKEIVREGTIALERSVLSQVLRVTGGNKAKAARLLQIDYKTIHTKVKDYGISMNGGTHHVRAQG